MIGGTPNISQQEGSRMPPEPSQPVGGEKYSYYFQRQRPASIQRLLERKHGRLLDAASRGRRIRSILEIGPGEGWVARASRHRGVASYRAVESTATGVAHMEQQGFDVVQGRVPPLPDGVEPVDLVYASHLIEHLPGPDAVYEFLVTCRAALLPGGELALVYPDARYLGGFFWDCDYTHQWPSTPHRVEQVAEDAGYRVVAQHPFVLSLRDGAARLVRPLTRLYPQNLLSEIDTRRSDFWFRGKSLIAPDALTVLAPIASPGRGNRVPG